MILQAIENKYGGDSGEPGEQSEAGPIQHDVDDSKGEDLKQDNNDTFFLTQVKRNYKPFRRFFVRNAESYHSFSHTLILWQIIIFEKSPKARNLSNVHKKACEY